MDFGAKSGAVSFVTKTSGLDNYVVFKPIGGQLRLDQAYDDGESIDYMVTDTADISIENGTFVAPDILTRDGFYTSNTGAPISWSVTGQRIIWPLSSSFGGRIILLGSFERGLIEDGAITRFDVTEAGSFAPNFLLSDGKPRIVATATVAGLINLIHNGVTSNIGTFTYAAGAVAATFTSTGGLFQPFVARDLVELVWSDPADNTLADVAMTLRALKI